LMDYGLRRLGRLMRLVPRGFSFVSDRYQRKTHCVLGSMGGERSDPTYASHKENNSRAKVGLPSCVIMKWSFVGLLFAARSEVGAIPDG